MIKPTQIQNIQIFTKTLRKMIPEIADDTIIQEKFSLGATTLIPHHKNVEMRKFFQQTLDLIGQHKKFNLNNNFFKKDGILFESSYDCAIKKCILAFENYKMKTGKDFVGFYIPDVFRGMDLSKTQIASFIDENSAYIKSKKDGRLVLKGINGNHYIDFQHLQYNVFELIRGKNKSLLKFCYNAQLQGHDAYAELALAHSALKAGVGNIPLLQIASPTPQKSWLIYEFITLDKPPRNDCSIFHFLKEFGYQHSDKHRGQFIGRYLVDLGGVEKKSDFQ